MSHSLNTKPLSKFFSYKHNELYCEDLPVRQILKDIPTPFYLYSYQTLLNNYQQFTSAFQKFPHLICYALKANPNLTIAAILAQAGAGVEVVSGGELFRAEKAGFPPQKTVFNGVGKTDEEIRMGLEKGILAFQAESWEELFLLKKAGQEMRKRVPLSLRINPDIDSETHRYITTGKKENKFGFPKEQILAAFEYIFREPVFIVKGLHVHLGSQITLARPYVRVLVEIILPFLKELEKREIYLEFLNLGGGLGITYHQENPLLPETLARLFLPYQKKIPAKIIWEPGRCLVGNAGILVTQVLYQKETSHKKFLIIDAGMNDLIRPALYGVEHEVLPIRYDPAQKLVITDVVGPICESGDTFLRQRRIPNYTAGDYLILASAGAYGMSMASQYNSRPRPAEVLVKGNQWKTIRKRENFDDLVRGEESDRVGIF